MMVLSLIFKIFLLLSLGVASFIDIRKRQLPLLFILVMGIGTIGFQAILRTHSLLDLLAGAAVGVMLISISLLSKGAIGLADAITFMITGIALGLWPNFSLLIISLTLCAVFSIICALIKRKSMKSAVPFMPFILCGYVIMLAFL